MASASVGIGSSSYYLLLLLLLTGQIHDAFKDLLREQICQKIIAFEDHAKSSKVLL